MVVEIQMIHITQGVRNDNVNDNVSDNEQNVTLHKVYVMWLHLLFNTVLPFTALLYLNAAIYKRLVSVKKSF